MPYPERPDSAHPGAASARRRVAGRVRPEARSRHTARPDVKIASYAGTAAAKHSAVKILTAVSGAVLALLAAAQTVHADAFPLTGPTVPGTRAVLRGNVAAAPAAAPLEVKRAIWAANQLRSKRYRYGGGHRSFIDSGYDCSGTVSYALGAAGLVKSPMPSSGFKNFGKSGTGKWITVYARNGHTFAVIAGLRLDTTAWNTMRRETGEAPRWRATPREPRGFIARHPAGL